MAGGPCWRALVGGRIRKGAVEFVVESASWQGRRVVGVVSDFTGTTLGSQRGVGEIRVHLLDVGGSQVVPAMRRRPRRQIA